jgi:membrane fusion protein, multidrug efflux system
MKPWTFLAPFFFLALGFAVYYWWVLNPPEAGRRQPPRGVLVVDVATAEKRPYPVVLNSQGTVRAHTESSLLPEVSGRIVAVGTVFREGNFFEEGDMLIELDDSDYRTAVITAEAALAQARLRLVEEEARSRQALQDWKRLGSGDTPSALVLREPQLLEAQANVAAAEGRLELARRNLERTRIRAPYAGRVLQKNVDVGQFVSPGTALGRIYAVDYAEIRLPLAEWQLGFVDLPEIRRGNLLTERVSPEVTVKTSIGGRVFRWPGRVERAEGAIDAASRQLFVVAQVDDPYGIAHEAPLKVGMFVEAEIEGHLLEDVWVIPAEALRQGSHVLVVDGENRLYRQEVEVIWQDRASAVLPANTFAAPPRLCITPVAFAANGTSVVLSSIDGVEVEQPRRGPGGPGGPGALAGPGAGGRPPADGGGGPPSPVVAPAAARVAPTGGQGS